jgi:hypothetical protein
LLGVHRALPAVPAGSRRNLRISNHRAAGTLATDSETT